MKIKQTFSFDDEDRAAIGRELGCRRPATRTQCVQWVTECLTLARLEAAKRFRQAKLADEGPLLFGGDEEKK